MYSNKLSGEYSNTRFKLLRYQIESNWIQYHKPPISPQLYSYEER